jgi:outer membrane usher protein
MAPGLPQTLPTASGPRLTSGAPDRRRPLARAPVWRAVAVGAVLVAAAMRPGAACAGAGAAGSPEAALGEAGGVGELDGDAADLAFSHGSSVRPGPSARGAFCGSLDQWRAMFRSGAGAHADDLPELVLDATVNGIGPAVSVQPVCLASGRLALNVSDWRALGLRLTQEVVLPDGRKVLPLESIPGASYAVDTFAQTIAITAPAAAFDGTRVNGAPSPSASPPSPPPGGYLTYDTNLSYSGGVLDYGASLGGVLFGPWGLVSSSGTLNGNTAGGFSLVRGDTYWQRPDVADMTTLTVGDAVGVGGAWSRPLRFAGIQYQRDFTTRPGFITFPMPTIGGSAALPSTIDVLVNNEQRLTTKVPAGPFDITNVPIVSGSGQLQLVVNDALGRQTLVTQNYYTGPQLLKPGLTDFSYEAGFERLDYAVDSFDYGHFVADATYRRGMTDWLTLEGRAEAESTRAAFGGALWSDVDALGILQAATAWSVSANGREGGTYLLGFQSIGPRLGVSVTWQYFDRGYRPYAYDPGESLPRDQVSAGGGAQIGHAGSFTLDYVRESRWGQPSSEFVNGAWSKSYGRFNLSLSANKDILNRDWSVAFTLGFTFGRNISVSSNVTTGPGVTTGYVEAASPIPTGPGFGWNLRAGTDTNSVEASGVYNAPDAILSANLAAGAGSVSARIDAAGSIGMVGGYVFASRPINSGFAVVRTGDVAGAPVMLWNQPAAVTGRNGYALITGLGPYQDNKISIDPDSLPIDVEVGAASVNAQLWPRAGVFVDFPVRRTRAALVALRQTNGDPVPLGAKVTFRPGMEPALVAQDGEVWLTDLADRNHLTVIWPDGGCAADLAIPKTLEPAAKLGPILCAVRTAN